MSLSFNSFKIIKYTLFGIFSNDCNYFIKLYIDIINYTLKKVKKSYKNDKYCEIVRINQQFKSAVLFCFFFGVLMSIFIIWVTIYFNYIYLVLFRDRFKKKLLFFKQKEKFLIIKYFFIFFILKISKIF